MDSFVNACPGHNSSQTRKNESSTPAPKFGGIKKKMKKAQLTRRARISLNTSTSGRKKIKTLASKINTSLNSSRIVKEALHHNNRALVTEQQRIQNEIQHMRQKCEDLVEENEDIVYELEMINNLMNLANSEEKVQAVVDMRVQAYMIQMTDEIEKTVYNFKQALKDVVSLRGLIKDPRRIMSMSLDSPRDDDEEITLSYMERLQEIFINTDIYDEHDNDMINNDDNLPDNHVGMNQVNNPRYNGFVGLPQRIPCSSTVPEQNQGDSLVTNEFDEALEDDFDLVSNTIIGNVQNVDQRLSNGQDLLAEEHPRPKYPRKKSIELSEDYNFEQEDMTMYPNTDMEMTTMIGTNLISSRPSLSPKSPISQPSVEPLSSSVKSPPKPSPKSSSSKSSSRSPKSSSSKSSSRSPKSSSSKSSSRSPKSSSSKSSQSKGQSLASSGVLSPTQQPVTSSSLINNRVEVPSSLSSNRPVTNSLASSENFPSSQAPDLIDPEHTIYLNSDMEMTAVVEAPFSFIEPQPQNFQKSTSSFESFKTPIVASEKQNPQKVSKMNKFGPENLFGFEVETPKFDKPSKTTELSKIDKFERIKIETSFTLDKSIGEECLAKATKSRSRTKPRSKKAVVEEIGIFNSEPSEFHDTLMMSEEKTKSTSIEKSQGTSRSKRKLVQRDGDDLEDSEPCVLLTIPSQYTVPLNKESPSPKKSKSRSQSRGRSKGKKREKAVISGRSGEIVNEQKISSIPLGKSESETKKCEENGLMSDTYTVPMKKDSPVSNNKSTSRSQSRGRSKTKKKKETQSVDTRVNEEEETQEMSKTNKPKSISVSDDISDVYTVPMKTDSPETKPRLRTRSQSRGRSKNKPEVSSDTSSDATILPIQKHSPSKSVSAKNFQKEKHSKVQNQSDFKDTYDVPLKDIECSKSKSRGRSHSRTRSKKREVILADGNGTKEKAVPVTVDTLKEADKDQKGDDHSPYDEDDVISPTVHIQPKCFRKRMIVSDDIDSPIPQINLKETKKAVIDDDDDEMIPDSQPVKPIVPLRSKKRTGALASETDDEIEDHKTKSSLASPIDIKTKNIAKKPKSIAVSPKQILPKPEILVIPDSTKKPRTSVIRDIDDDEDQENLVGKRSRRNKGCVSYKEKPLNVKMRRETVDGKTVEYVNTGRLSEKVLVSEIQPLDSVSNNRNSSS